MEMDGLQHKVMIQMKVKQQIDKVQKEYYLKEQMKAIQNELGDKDGINGEIAEYRRKEEQIEPELVDVILKIFADITKTVSVDKKDMILTLVNNVMTGGEASRNFVIKASVEDAAFLRENKEKIEGATRNDIQIEIVSDPSMKRNECLIDTDTGVYDCSLDIQLENLINDIRILSATGE